MCRTWCQRTMAVVLVLCCMGALVRLPAQEKQHVVSLDELQRDSAQPAETRQSNEAAIRRVLSSEPGQNALRSAKIDYAQVDKAVGQLSDEDLTKLAERSRQVENDFAAGSLSDRDLLVIIIIAVLVIALIAVLH